MTELHLQGGICNFEIPRIADMPNNKSRDSRPISAITRRISIVSLQSSNTCTSISGAGDAHRRYAEFVKGRERRSADLSTSEFPPIGTRRISKLSGHQLPSHRPLARPDLGIFNGPAVDLENPKLRTLRPLLLGEISLYADEQRRKGWMKVEVEKPQP